MGEEIPAYLARMVRRSAPTSAVVTGSTPVIAFGDPRRARVATLGINPSWREFQSADRNLLTGQSRRLATLPSLGAELLTELAEEYIQTVAQDCSTYFFRNPYRRWFDPLDRVLRNGLDASYYDGSACHLDLVQWATSPTWGKLAPKVRQCLLDDGLPHLRDQLLLGNLRFVVLNGRQVLDNVVRVGLAKLESCGTLHNKHLHCSLYSGLGEGVRFLGWSTNLQGNFGVSNKFKSQLSRWLADAAERAWLPVSKEDASMSLFREAIDASGYIVKGTEVASKFELLQLLQAWLATSDKQRISAAEYGRTPWIFMPLDHGRRVQLNADTKRSAIAEYVKSAQARGADLPWSVIRSKKGSGPWSKLVFRVDREPTPGWYCYLQPVAAGGEEV